MENFKNYISAFFKYITSTVFVTGSVMLSFFAVGAGTFYATGLYSQLSDGAFNVDKLSAVLKVSAIYIVPLLLTIWALCHAALYIYSQTSVGKEKVNKFFYRHRGFDKGRDPKSGSSYISIMSYLFLILTVTGILTAPLKLIEYVEATDNYVTSMVLKGAETTLPIIELTDVKGISQSMYLAAGEGWASLTFFSYIAFVVMLAWGLSVMFKVYKHLLTLKYKPLPAKDGKFNTRSAKRVKFLMRAAITSIMLITIPLMLIGLGVEYFGLSQSVSLIVSNWFVSWDGVVQVPDITGETSLVMKEIITIIGLMISSVMMFMLATASLHYTFRDNVEY